MVRPDNACDEKCDYRNKYQRTHGGSIDPEMQTKDGVFCRKYFLFAKNGSVKDPSRLNRSNLLGLWRLNLQETHSCLGQPSPAVAISNSQFISRESLNCRNFVHLSQRRKVKELLAEVRVLWLLFCCRPDYVAAAYLADKLSVANYR